MSGDLAAAPTREAVLESTLRKLHFLAEAATAHLDVYEGVQIERADIKGLLEVMRDTAEHGLRGDQ